MKVKINNWGRNITLNLPTVGVVVIRLGIDDGSGWQCVVYHKDLKLSLSYRDDTIVANLYPNLSTKVKRAIVWENLKIHLKRR